MRGKRLVVSRGYGARLVDGLRHRKATPRRNHRFFMGKKILHNENKWYVTNKASINNSGKFKISRMKILSPNNVWLIELFDGIYFVYHNSTTNPTPVPHPHEPNYSNYIVLRTSKGELRCRRCGEFLPDKFKTIAVLYGLPIEAELNFDPEHLGWKPYKDD